MSFLERIVVAKRAAVEAARRVVSDQEMARLAAGVVYEPRGFHAALRESGVRVVAEIKRASPSLGDIRPDLDAAATARSYAAGGAAALSVLTEEEFFKGSAADLRAARGAVEIPVLRKDFIIDPYQLYESVVMGADAVLLIVRILSDEELVGLLGLAGELGLDVLTEIFDEEEGARAMAAGAELVGINNRDLAHFTTDPARAGRVASGLREGTTVVALSGIHARGDVEFNLAQGISRFLVGEALVRAESAAELLREFRGVGDGV